MESHLVEDLAAQKPVFLVRGPGTVEVEAVLVDEHTLLSLCPTSRRGRSGRSGRSAALTMFSILRAIRASDDEGGCLEIVKGRMGDPLFHNDKNIMG